MNEVYMCVYEIFQIQIQYCNNLLIYQNIYMNKVYILK